MTSESDAEVCTAPECGRPQKARGLCHRHYAETRAAWMSEQGLLCAVDGCEGTAKTRGHCTMHYMRVIRLGDPGPAGRIATPPRDSGPCAVDGCQNQSARRRGRYCDMHALRVHRHGDPGPAGRLIAPRGQDGCRVEGCPRPHTARGYCSKHYASIYLRERAETCQVDGCEGKLRALGYCSRHYYAARHGHGKAVQAIDQGCTCALCARYRTERPEEEAARPGARAGTRVKPERVIAGASRWRNGVRDDTARAAHNAEMARLRRRAVRAEFRPVEARLLKAIGGGVPIGRVAEQVGVTVQAVFGRARWDGAWRARLDAALVQGRDPAIAHGIEYSYRVHRCRCPDCRAAKGRYR